MARAVTSTAALPSTILSTIPSTAFRWQLERLDRHRHHAILFHIELVGHLGRDVDDASGHIRPAVLDGDDVALARVQIGDPGLGPERQRLAGGGVGVGIHGLAVRHVLAVEAAAVIRRLALARASRTVHRLVRGRCRCRSRCRRSGCRHRFAGGRADARAQGRTADRPRRPVATSCFLHDDLRSLNHPCRTAPPGRSSGQPCFKHGNKS